MRGEITITDDDSSPTPTVNNPSVAEGNTGLTDLAFDVTLPCPRPAVTFNYRTVADTATASDFTEVGGAPLVFQSCGAGPATTLKPVIKVKGDTLDEPDESFKLELVNPTTGAIVRTATGTITNDDNNSKLSINDASSDEPGTMTFTVTLSPASAREVKVNWATADGTATAGSDYTGNSGQLTFAPGETSKTIDVSVIGDTTVEENETLKVLLSSPVGIPAANLIDAQGDGTIVDKNAPPTLSISDTLAREGQGANFTVTLAGTTLRTVTVNFNTVDSAAKAGSDYAARTGTLSFAPGEKTKTITITVLDDTAAEPTEDFFVSIGDAVNAAITKNRGVGTIEASDQVAQPPTTDPTHAANREAGRGARAADDPRPALGLDRRERGREDARHLPEALADRLRRHRRAGARREAAAEARQEDIHGQEGREGLRVDQAQCEDADPPAQEQDDAGEGDRPRQDEHEDDEGLAGDHHAQGHSGADQVEAEAVADEGRRRSVEGRPARRYNSAVVPR